MYINLSRMIVRPSTCRRVLLEQVLQICFFFNVLVFCRKRVDRFLFDSFFIRELRVKL